jgi:hypothetical protein
MEVADIYDYFCGNGGEISAPVVDRTTNVRPVLSLYWLGFMTLQRNEEVVSTSKHYVHELHEWK